MLSDSEKYKPLKSRKQRKLNAVNVSWGDKQKQECVEVFYMLGGKLTETAAATGIPKETIKRWIRTGWWKDLYDEIKQTDNILLSHRLQKIMSRSLDLVEDRLEKGDFFYDQKKGELVRKEVSVRDAHAIFKDSFAVKEVIEKPVVAVVDTGTVAEKLTLLAQQFEQFAKSKPKVEVTDIVYIKEEHAENSGRPSEETEKQG